MMLQLMRSSVASLWLVRLLLSVIGWHGGPRVETRNP